MERGPHVGGKGLREAVLESLDSFGWVGALRPSVVLGPGSARRLRWPCHWGADRCRVRPAMHPQGSLRLAHPQPLPPGPPPGSPLPPRLACDLTWEPPSLDPSRCLGLGFPAWRRGCSRPGHMLLLKWGSRWGRLLPHRAGGPGDLGELLFRSRMVKDSPRASCLWDPHPLHSPFCLQGGQCRPWAVPPLPQPPPGLQGRGWVVTGYLAPGPRPGRPAGGAVQRGSAEVRSFLAPQERGCR